MVQFFSMRNYFKRIKERIIFYLGSKWKDDVSKREYSYNMLNKIIVNIE